MVFRSGYCSCDVSWNHESALPVPSTRLAFLRRRLHLQLYRFRPILMDWLGSQISMVTWVSPFLKTLEHCGRVAPEYGTSVGISITMLDNVLSNAVLNQLRWSS